MRYKIGICDDSQVDTDYVASLVTDWAEQSGAEVELKAYPSAESFLFQYEEESDYDILLLDIEMGQVNGMELARKIRQENQAVQIVFITGYPDYMSEGYDVTALHYLMKPVSAGKLSEVLDRAVRMLARQPRSLVFDLGKESLRVFAEDIVYGESQGHYILLHTKEQEYKFRMTFSELERQLGEGFYKCGRSYIVGLKYVRRITKTAVALAWKRDVAVENGKSIMSGGECGVYGMDVKGTDRNLELPLGKGLYDDMNRALIDYLRKQ